MTDDLTPDPELERLLQSRTGGTVEVSDAHSAVLARAGTIRRRRASIGSASLIAVVVIGVALLPRGGSDVQTPADQVDVPGVDEDLGSNDVDPVSLPTVPGTDTVASDADASSTPDAGETSVPGDSPSTTTASDRSTTTSPVVVATTTPTVAPGTTSSASATTPSTTTAPTVTVQTETTTTSPGTTTTEPGPAIAPFTRTYESVGGSVSIRWDGSSLTLLSVTAASGFDSEIEHQEPLRIRVRFRSDGDDSRIEVRIDGGELIEEIT